MLPVASVVIDQRTDTIVVLDRLRQTFELGQVAAGSQDQRIDVRNGHTTKVRLRLDLNEAGREAGIPAAVCLKSNWSEGFDSGDICELEARFYFHIANQLSVPAPKAYYADWDADGSGQGLVVMEDLAVAPGEFGNSADHLGVDGVAKGLFGLASGSSWDPEDAVLRFSQPIDPSEVQFQPGT